MSDRRDVPGARGRAIVCALAAIVAALCVYAVRQVDADFYGYLAYGRLFSTSGWNVGIDPFAYTNEGVRWVTFEYLAQTAIWKAYAIGGALGLIALKCALGGAAVAFLWLACRQTSRDLTIAVPVFLFATTTACRYFLFRPQLFTFACFALFVFVLFRWLRYDRGPLLLLPVVMLVWVNAHGGFLAGLGAIGLAILLKASSVPEAAASVDVSSRVRRVTPLLIVLGACLAVSFVNPHGAGLWRYVINELSHDTNRRYIDEWRPAGWENDPWSAIALTFMLFMVISIVPMATRTKTRVAGLAPWAWAASALPLIAMSFMSVRHTPLAAIWAAPVIVLLAEAARSRGSEEQRRRFRTAWLVLGTACLVPVLLTLQYVWLHPRPQIAEGGALLGRRNPCHVVEFIRENDLRGNVFLPLWWGSYATWRAHPAIRVSMDGRNISAFRNETVAENLRFYSAGVTSGDENAPLNYATDFLVVPADAAVLASVRADARWRQIYVDPDAVLFDRGQTPAKRYDAPADGVCGTVFH